MNQYKYDFCFHFIAHCPAPDGPIMNLNRRAGDWLNIFVDIPIKCSGALDKWEFYATNKGVFYASIWRETVDHNETWTMIGSNKIEATHEGPQVISIKVNRT